MCQLGARYRFLKVIGPAPVIRFYRMKYSTVNLKVVGGKIGVKLIFAAKCS